APAAWLSSAIRVSAASASSQPPVQRVRAGMHRLSEDVAVERAAQLGTVEASFDRRARHRERVQREHVVVNERVVPRRIRAVVAEVVAGELDVAGEPAGEVVDALARSVEAGHRDLRTGLAPGDEAAAERA